MEAVGGSCNCLGSWRQLGEGAFCLHYAWPLQYTLGIFKKVIEKSQCGKSVRKASEESSDKCGAPVDMPPGEMPSIPVGIFCILEIQ